MEHGHKARLVYRLVQTCLNCAPFTYCRLSLTEDGESKNPQTRALSNSQVSHFSSIDQLDCVKPRFFKLTLSCPTFNRNLCLTHQTPTMHTLTTYSTQSFLFNASRQNVVQNIPENAQNMSWFFRTCKSFQQDLIKIKQIASILHQPLQLLHSRGFHNHVAPLPSLNRHVIWGPT